MFLNHPVGFEHLKKKGWIEKALVRWKDTYNKTYLEKVDKVFAEKLGYLHHSKSSIKEDHPYSFWLVMFSQSEDLRNETSKIKRIPFCIEIKIEDRKG